MSKENNEFLRKEYLKYLERQKKHGRKALSYGQWKDRIYRNMSVAGIGAGVLTIPKSTEMIKGTKTIYHGTRNDEKNPDRINQIYKTGLRTDFGGSNIAKRDEIAAKEGKLHPKFLNASEQSKNKIHFSDKQQYAAMYAFIKREYTKNEKNGKYKTNYHIDPENGEVFRMKVPYDVYKRSVVDNKIGAMAGDKLGLKGNLGQKVGDFYTNNVIGAKTVDVDIDPRAFIDNPYYSKEEKKKYQRDNFKQYAKNHKGRLAAGVALGTAAGAAATLGAYTLIKSERERRKAYEDYLSKNDYIDYKDFKKNVLKECYKILYENFDIVVENKLELDKNDIRILNSTFLFE